MNRNIKRGIVLSACLACMIAAIWCLSWAYLNIKIRRIQESCRYAEGRCGKQFIGQSVPVIYLSLSESRRNDEWYGIVVRGPTPWFMPAGSITAFLFSPFQSISEVGLWSAPPETLKLLIELNNLEALTLACVDDPESPVLLGIYEKQLRHLTLLADARLPAYPRMPQWASRLESISLNRLQQFDSNMCRNLYNAPRLSSISISNMSNVDLEAVTSMLGTLPILKNLMWIYAPKDEAFARRIGELPRLESLIISGDGLTDAMVKSISNSGS